MNIPTIIVVPDLGNSFMLILFVVFTLWVDKKMEGSALCIKAGLLFIQFLEAFFF